LAEGSGGHGRVDGLFEEKKSPFQGLTKGGPLRQLDGFFGKKRFANGSARKRSGALRKLWCSRISKTVSGTLHEARPMR
jgi:hypothetical protein